GGRRGGAGGGGGAAGAGGGGDGGGLPGPYERGGAVGGGVRVPAAGAGVGGEGQGLLLGGGDEPGAGHRRAAARVGVPDERRAGGQHVAQGVGGAPAVVGDQDGGRAEDRLAGLVGGGAGPAVAAVQAGHGPVPGQHAGLLRQRPGERQGDDLDPGPQEPFQFAAGRVAAQRGDEGDLAAVAGGEVGGEGGAAGPGRLRAVVDDGDGRVGGEPVGAAGEVAVEQGVADDQQGGLDAGVAHDVLRPPVVSSRHRPLSSAASKA